MVQRLKSAWGDTIKRTFDTEVLWRSVIEGIESGFYLPTVADLGFPRGAPTYFLANFFFQNCMKIKKFWLGGGASVPRAPLDLPLTEALYSFPCVSIYVCKEGSWGIHLFIPFKWSPNGTLYYDDSIILGRHQRGYHIQSQWTTTGRY